MKVGNGETCFNLTEECGEDRSELVTTWAQLGPNLVTALGQQQAVSAGEAEEVGQVCCMYQVRIQGCLVLGI